MTYSKLISYLFVTTTIVSLDLPLFRAYPTLVYVLIYICVLIFIFLGRIDKEFQFVSSFPRKVFTTFWLYSIFIIIYGLIYADVYWDYKIVMIRFIPGVIISFAIFLGLRFEESITLLKLIIKKILPIICIIGLFSYILFYNYHILGLDNYLSRSMAPLYFFILATPFLKREYKIYVIIFSIICIIIDPEWRVNILRLLSCYSFILIYYLFSLRKIYLNIMGIIIFSIPLIFLYSGIKGNFDIFELMAGDNENNNTFQINTRTFLYDEIFASIVDEENNLFIGGGASAKYKTTYFHDQKRSIYVDQTRYMSEVAFLNTLKNSGIIGVLIDALIIFVSGYYAINRSNNNFSKLLGLYMYFSWIIYFLEMPQALSSVYFFYYFIIGVCLNNSFRMSSDKKIKLFFKSL